MESVSFAEVLKQICIAVPAMIAGASVLSQAIFGVFNIASEKAKTIIIWVLNVITGVGLVAFNGLTFGLPVWANYLMGAGCGIVAALASTKLLDWEKIKKILELIADLLGVKVHGNDYYKVKCGMIPPKAK